MAAACGITVGRIETHKALFRPVLQWWGTEFRRGQDPDYWVRQAAGKICNSPADLIVIPDVRFPNERDLVIAGGGHVFWVDRYQHGLDAHASENSITPADCLAVINNHGTLLDFKVSLRDTFLTNATAFQLWRQLNERNDTQAQAAHDRATAGALGQPA